MAIRRAILRFLFLPVIAGAFSIPSFAAVNDFLVFSNTDPQVVPMPTMLMTTGNCSGTPGGAPCMGKGNFGFDIVQNRPDVISFSFGASNPAGAPLDPSITQCTNATCTWGFMFPTPTTPELVIKNTMTGMDLMTATMDVNECQSWLLQADPGGTVSAPEPGTVGLLASGLLGLGLLVGIKRMRGVSVASAA